MLRQTVGESTNKETRLGTAEKGALARRAGKRPETNRGAIWFAYKRGEATSSLRQSRVPLAP